MRIGMVGLGRMGASMTIRLVQGGHEVVAFDVNAEAVASAAAEGASPAASLPDLVGQLTPPRVVWLMVPAGEITQNAIDELAGLLGRGDAIVDGGNSRYTDSLRRAEDLGERDIDFVDSGTSGGVWGLKNGYCLMVGGKRESIERLEPLFHTLAPEKGYAHVGPPGAGHFVKMVHNGIEYGLMQAYGEGFELLHKNGEFDLDLGQIAEVWRHGSVVRSWLLDLVASALEKNPDLDGISDYVEDSGEGRWTLDAAIDQSIPMPSLALALFTRFASRQDELFAGKLIAALRNEFGGHALHAREVREKTEE
ncbi:MAG TPA: decarboxylating 6-phosphogluconate dehydrogenase [Actinomycetota bacterium]|jgi:6-phosphogluconate dehydrogenase